MKAMTADQTSQSTSEVELLSFRLAEEEKAAMEAMVRKMEAQQNEGAILGRADEQSKVVTEKKIPRNDPCPCGSGKKYKQCCGKSGPKRGLLA